VWDGDQALYEIQMLEAEQENDGVPTHIARFGNDEFDPNPLMGRVLHTYGPAIDQPLSVIRLAFANRPEGWGYQLWQPFAVIPVWDYQGRAPYVLFANGARTRCEGDGRCLGTEWNLGWKAYGARSNGSVTSTTSQAAWLGNVMEDHHDASGLLYRRNRYYNPQTGRFTQEDPIGLAGGMNAYGFAAGDPASYSDPFGLCIPPGSAICVFLTAYREDGIRGVVNEAVGVTPLGDLNDLATAASGRNLITGRSVGNGGRAFAALGAMVPLASSSAIRSVGRQGEEILHRFGTEIESVEQLAEQASRAEAGGFPHGVSVFNRPSKRHASSTARRSDVEAEFPVAETGSRGHRTVVLPKPVTQVDADTWNRLLGRIP
jgi:RHS repeat-associated protein